MHRPTAPFLLVALWSAVFLPGLLGGRTWPARDAGATHIPWRAEMQRQLAAGHAPWWNPLANGGRPLWANPNAQAAYPPTLLLLPLGPERSLAASLALHHLLFLLGCYTLARRVGAGPGAAGVAAAAVGFSGVPLSATLLANLQASLAWGPWALATALPHPGSAPGSRRALLGGALVGLSFLGGEPVTAAAAALAWTLVTLWVGGRGTVGRLLLAGLAAVGVAAPLLAPLVQCYPDTVRATLGVAPDAVAADALAPRRWAELWLPHLLGDFHHATAPDFWAAASFPWLRYFPAVFVGLLPLLLAARAGLSRSTAPWWVLAAGGVAVAVGGAFPLFAEIFAAAQGRFAIKALVLPAWALAPLVALGWERMAAATAASRRRLLAVGLAALLPLAPVALFPHRFARPLLVRAYPAAAPALAELPTSSLAAGLRLDLGALALPLASLAATTSAPVLTTALGGAGVLATWGLLASDRAARWVAPPAAAQGLAPGTRLVAWADAAAPTPGEEEGPLSRYRAMRAALLPNYPNRWGLGTILERGPDGLESARHELLAAAAATFPLEQRLRIAAALGATVAITAQKLPGLAGEQLDGVWRWQLPGAPEVYAARRIHPARGPLATAATLASPVFRPGQDAVIEGDGGVEELGEAEVKEEGGPPHRRVFRVTASAPTLLVVQQSQMRCWTAQVDGRRAAIQTVNGAMLGVWVGAGEHQVRLAVDATPYRLGLAALVLVLAALWFTGRGRARPDLGAPSDGGAHSSPASSPVR